MRLREAAEDAAVRVFEGEASQATYAAADLAGDFPGGLDGNSRVAVAQWDDGYGWGMEAFVGLTT